MDVFVKRFLNNIYQPKLITLTVPKESCLSLFLGPHSLYNLGLVCHVFFHEKLPHCNVRFVFKSTSRLYSIFISKTEYLSFYALASFINSSAIAAMLSIMV